MNGTDDEPTISRGALWAAAYVVFAVALYSFAVWWFNAPKLWNVF